MNEDLARATDAAVDAVAHDLRLKTDAYLHVKGQPGRLVKVVHIVEAAARAALQVRPGVAGYCPGCGKKSLFLAAGGHVTCRRAECPAPAVDLGWRPVVGVS